MTGLPASFGHGVQLHANPAAAAVAAFGISPTGARSCKRPRLPGRIARELAAAILSGHYGPGDRLFGEIAFSDRLNVSRATYREAIQILTTKGMVSSNPRRGTIVNPRSMWQLLDPEVLRLVFETGPQAGILADLREILDMLVPKAAALAAVRRTDETPAQLRALFEAMLRADANGGGAREVVQDFHMALLLASDNAYVVSLARGLAAALHATLTYQWQHGCDPMDHVQYHFRILKAITERDGDGAERAARNLIARIFIDLAGRKCA